MRVTVLVRKDEVVVRGRDGTGVVRLEEVVPLPEMREEVVQEMRRKLSSYS